MSAEEQSSRKAKKAQRDEERRKIGKKRKRDDVQETKDAAAVQSDELQQDFIPLGLVTADQQNGAVKSKSSSSKKRKAEALERNGEPNAETAADTAPKPKKRKKQKKPVAENGEATADFTAVPSKNNHRFVCFIGNLPYATTDVSLQAHFKKIAPFTLRHRTDPATKKSKGFAFLEFENYDRMKTCLKLYHHSMFDPDDATGDIEGTEEDANGNAKRAQSKKGKGARRINVELTAGGGGKNDGRKEKIKVKNQRLTEQRMRRAEAERIERVREAKHKVEGGKDAEKSGKKKQEQQQQQPIIPRVDQRELENTAGMHPSRLARMKT